jgi:hypothetical protein
MEWVVIALLIVLIWMVVRVANGQSIGQSRKPVDAAELERAKDAATQDVDRFHDEVQELDYKVQLAGAQPALVQDWQRALDSYDTAKRALDAAERPEDLQQVTTALENGRYAVACVRARRAGKPLPERRPPETRPSERKDDAGGDVSGPGQG